MSKRRKSFTLEEPAKLYAWIIRKFGYETEIIDNSINSCGLFWGLEYIVLGVKK